MKALFQKNKEKRRKKEEKKKQEKRKTWLRKNIQKRIEEGKGGSYIQ